MSFLTSGVGSVIGGVASGIGSLVGSSQASSSSEDAANKQLQMYYQTRSDLQPYSTAGQSAMTSALSLAQGSPTGGGPDYVTQAYQNMPGQLTQAELEQTPGYQWNLAQGLKATQSAAAARGLGVSGASLKGAATYATGLADSTYQNQFSNAQSRFKDYLDLNTNQQTNLQNQYSRLSGLATIGQNAAAQTGTAGTSAANAYGNYTSAAGTAQAAGTSGVGNALTSGINNYMSYNTLQSLLNKNSGSGSSGAVSGMTNWVNSTQNDPAYSGVTKY